MCRVGELNADPYLLNCENGTVDLRTGKLRPHNPADRITQLAPVEYRADADCLKWLDSMALIFDGDDELGRTTSSTYDVKGNLLTSVDGAGFVTTYVVNSRGLPTSVNRWYDANLGQWLNEDPIGFAAGDTNVRRYVGNGALYRTDPLGLWWWDDDWLELGVGGLLGLQGEEVHSASGASIIENPLRGGLDVVSMVDLTPLSGGVSRILEGAIEGHSVSEVVRDIALEALPGPSPRKGSKIAGVVSHKNPVVTSVTGGAGPVRVGQAGEAVASRIIGLPKNKLTIPSASESKSFVRRILWMNRSG